MDNDYKWWLWVLKRIICNLSPIVKDWLNHRLTGVTSQLTPWPGSPCSYQLQCICIHNDPRLGGNHQDAHSSHSTPRILTSYQICWHQPLTLSLSPVWVNIGAIAHISTPGFFLIPNRGLRSYLKVNTSNCQIFSWFLACSSPVMARTIVIGWGWMFDLVCSSPDSPDRSNVHSSLIHSRSPLLGSARVQITITVITISGICFLIAFIKGRIWR